MQLLLLIKNKKMKRKNARTNPVCLFWRYVLLAFCLIGMKSVPAFSIDFITQDEFETKTIDYKDYPFKILFEKFFESSGPEKRKIRNMIILKQVFERNMQEKAKAGIIQFKRSFGIVKDIGKDNLRLWDPKNNRFKDFYVGIDQIPLENKNNYRISELTLGKFASIIYSIDNRIYRIEIRFELAAPEGLYVKRRKKTNILGWNEPAAPKKPSRYRVFVNGKPFKTVEDTVVEVPRTEGQLDEYYVLSVYKHGDSYIESGASPIVYDEISAKEKQQELLAEQNYSRIVAALNASDWEKARKDLYENRKLLTNYLDPRRKAAATDLIGFFRAIDEGDRLSRIEFESIKNLETALASYRRAEQKAGALSESTDVVFLAQQKIKEAANRKALLVSRQQKLQVEQAYDRIITALNTSEWEKARRVLYENQKLLADHLDPRMKADATGLVGFFRAIDEGDRLSRLQPESAANLDMALAFYQRAEQKASTLSDSIDVVFFVQQKIKEATNRQVLLEERQQKLLAEQIYSQIIAALSASDWQKGRRFLYDNRDLLTAHLDPLQQAVSEGLIDIFRAVDEGDRISRQEPDSIRNLDTALAFYQRAEQKAGTLSGSVDVVFLARQKIKENADRKALLESRRQQRLAGQIYDRIITALNASDGKEARRLLFNNRDLLTDHLDQQRKSAAKGLIDFFHAIDEGDRLSRLEPESVENLDMALAFYQRAEQKAKALSESVDVLPLTRQKIKENADRKTLLESGQQQRFTEQTYDRIMAALNASDWVKARNLLFDNRKFLMEHLDQQRKARVSGLIGFFRAIDEGDRITRQQPDSLQNLDTALAFYQRAEQKARALSDGMDVLFLARQKIKENADRKAMVESRREKLRAEKTYDRIFAGLNDAEWESARTLLYENQKLLTDHPDQQRNADVAGLIGFFRVIDEGDRAARLQPESIKNLDTALEFYRRAEKKALTLPDSVDVTFIAQKKIRENTDQRTLLENRQKRRHAEQAYNSIIEELNVSEWEGGRRLLQENQNRLTSHLDENRKSVAKGLVDFFQIIDEGEQAARLQPESLNSLDRALAVYRRAEQKALTFKETVDVSFIVQRKIKETDARRALLEIRQQHRLAQQIYGRITATLSASEWVKARKLLYENRKLLTDRLDPKQKAAASGLVGFFRAIDEGDRVTRQQPDNIKNLDTALAFYRRAEEKAKALLEDTDVVFLAQQKIKENTNRKILLEGGQQNLLAEQIYSRVIAGLNVSDWDKTRRLLNDNQNLLTMHLDQQKKASTLALVDFFRAVDEGDRISSQTPDSARNLDMALVFYQRAQQKARSLPENTDVAFIVQQKIKETADRKTLLVSRAKKRLAAETYDRIIAWLNASDWERARNHLHQNQKLLTDHLDPKRKAAALDLVGFFRDIDEGDRAAGLLPESIQNLDTALVFYQRAGQRGRALAEDVDIAFIVQQKIKENTDRKALFEIRQQKRLAEKTYDRIIAALNESEWESARTLLYENQKRLTDQLDPKLKAATLGLAGFFRAIDEGDQTAGLLPESIKNLDAALAFYRRAEKKAGALPDGTDVLFLVRQKIKENANRKALLISGQQKLLAQKIYGRITAALSASNWGKASGLLYENQHLLTEHLDQEQKTDTTALIDFFRAMDEGDRISRRRPQSVKDLEMALEFYRRAEQKAMTLPEPVNVSLIIKQKIKENANQKALLEGGQQKRLARQTYDRVIAGLNEAEWEKTRNLLYDNQNLLAKHLDREQKTNTAALIDFFRAMDEGDRISRQQPESVKNLDMALAFYRRAEQKAGELPDGSGLALTARQKIKDNTDQKALLEGRQQERLVRQTYERIIKGLDQAQWDKARKLLYDNQNLLAKHLDREQKTNTAALIDFFRAMDEGDRISLEQPESIKNLEMALVFYQRAEQKAGELTEGTDAASLARQKIDEHAGRKEELETLQKKTLAAKRLQEEPKIAPQISEPERIDETRSQIRTKKRLPITIARREPRGKPFSVLSRALIDFDDKKYKASLDHFMKAYGKQILRLKKGGKRQIFGLLALPPQYRAEIIFLVKLDKLEKTHKNDKAAIREGLQEISDSIEDGTGPWAIVSETKKNKIKNHIDGF